MKWEPNEELWLLGAIEEGGPGFLTQHRHVHGIFIAQVLRFNLMALALCGGRAAVTHIFQKCKQAEIPVAGCHKILKGCRLNFKQNCLTSAVATSPHDK